MFKQGMVLLIVPLTSSTKVQPPINLFLDPRHECVEIPLRPPAGSSSIKTRRLGARACLSKNSCYILLHESRPNLTGPSPVGTEPHFCLLTRLCFVLWHVFFLVCHTQQSSQVCCTVDRAACRSD